MAPLDQVRRMVTAPSRRVTVPWGLWIVCAAAGILSGAVLRMGLTSAQNEPLPVAAIEAVEKQAREQPRLPRSLNMLEPELHRTLAAGHQAAAEAKERRQSLEAVAGRLSPAEFAEAARRGVELPPEERRLFLAAVIRRWAEYSGTGAIAFAASRAPEELRSELIGEALDRWASVKPPAALEWILQHSRNDQRTEYLHRFIRGVEEKDPAAALAAVDKLPRSGEAEVIRERLARQLAEKDLPGAITALLRESWGDQSARNAAVDLAERWLAYDPAGVLAWTKQIRDDKLRGMFEDRLAAAWARKDVHAALEWVRSQPSTKQSSLLHSVLMEWSSKDPGAAREYALSLPKGDDRSFAILAVASEVGVKHRDARAFLEMHQQLDTLEEERKRPELLREIIGHSRREFREGAELLMDLPASEKNQQLFDRYLSRWLWDEPEKATDFLKENNLLTKMPEAARSYALQLARNDADAAVKWGNELPSGTARDLVHCALTYGLAAKDPERAAHILERDVPAGLQPSTARLLAEQWLEKDVVRATNWAQSLKNEEARAIACATIAATWSHRDLTGPVVQWIESLPPGATYDVAAASYARNVSSTDPAAALDWVSTISDPQLRQLQIESYAQAWLRSNRTEATRWVEESQLLPSEVKEWLLKEGNH